MRYLILNFWYECDYGAKNDNFGNTKSARAGNLSHRLMYSFLAA